MIDGTPLAWNRLTPRNKDVNGRKAAGACVLYRIELPLDLGALTAKFVEQPGVGGFRVRQSQLDMMESQEFRILHQLDLCAPRTLNESRPVKPGNSLDGLDHLGVDCGKLAHFGVDIRNRETEMLDHTTLTAARGSRTEKHQTHGPIHNAIGRFGNAASSRNILLPPD